MQSAFSADRFYGGPASSSGPAPAVATPRREDPHDKSDPGPSDWFEDPLFWLIVAAALGTGVVGFRFHWGPGARASASADIADEAASMVGHAFTTIAIILILKVLATKIEIPGLQKMAAAI